MHFAKCYHFQGKKPGLVVRAEGLCPRGRGFKSRGILMDVSDVSYYVFNEKGNKGSQIGHTKKIFFKNVIICIL